MFTQILDKNLSICSTENRTTSLPSYFILKIQDEKDILKENIKHDTQNFIFPPFV